MRLFKDDGSYTDQGNELDREYFPKFQAIAEKLDNPRELQVLLGNAASLVASTILLTRMSKRYRENKEAPQQYRLPLD